MVAGLDERASLLKQIFGGGDEPPPPSGPGAPALTPAAFDAMFGETKGTG